MENSNKYLWIALAVMAAIIIIMALKIKAKNELIDNLAASYDDATYQANSLRKVV